MLHHRAVFALLLPLLPACADEVVAPTRDGEVTTCEGPAWTYEHDLGFTRWSDTGGEAAESGDVVLVVWQERLENTSGQGDQVHGRFLDAATGAPRGDLAPIASDFSEVWVRPVDSGFVVFVRASFNINVYRVARDGGSFVYVDTQPDGDLMFNAVATDAGVLAFGQGELLHIGHDGRLRRRESGGIVGETTCQASAALPDGRVAAWCTDRTGAALWLTLDADGSGAVARPIDMPLEWPPVMVAADVGVFVALPSDEEELHIALFDFDGQQRVAPVPVRLRTVEAGDDVGIIGVNSCTATCDGVTLVGRGPRAILEVKTVPGGTERFELLVDDDAITMSSRGVREVVTRQTLTATTTSPLSTWTRYAPHVPILDGWPPQVLVVDRPCLRTAIDPG